MNEYSKTPNQYEFADSEHHDFTFVNATARIALYDDLRSAPRILTIEPAETTQYIENIASKIYEQAKMAGGTIPYTVIREVSENFIHARFKEIVVSILDSGNTIRFADQGPGIQQKEKAQLPGFSSAIEPMKRYIRGVGSGLPIVREYLDFSHGSITIEDNLGAGSVVTISLKEQVKEKDSLHPNRASQHNQHPIPPLSQREKSFLSLFLTEGSALGVTEISKLTGTAPSSTHVTLKKLEEAGLIQVVGKKRMLTDFGEHVASSL